jgi:hypothetical protein
MKRMMNVGLAFVFAMSTLLLSSYGLAQTPTQGPDQSLADYARKVHKDTGSDKAKPKVFDNDNLPKDDKLSIVGKQTVAEAKSGAEEEASEKPATETKPAPDAKAAPGGKADAAADEKAKKEAEWKGWQDKIKGQKDLISLASRELDVTQREYQLRAAAMYADAGNRMRNETQWDKEDAKYKQQIADKQKALDDAKQKLEDMQEEAHRAGVPSSMTE